MRVENLGKNVSEYCRSTGNGSSTWDLCPNCASELDSDSHCFDEKLIPYNAGEPMGDAGRGGDCGHPAYSGEDYKCEICNVELTDDD